MGKMNLLDSVINAAGQIEGFCIIKSVLQKTNAKGADYLDMILCDAGGEIDAKLWDYSPETYGSYVADSIVKVRATVNIWKESQQLKIDKIRNSRPDDQVDMTALVPCAPFAPQTMYDELFACAEDFRDGDLKLLTQYLLKTNKEKLLKYPAALKLHHAVRGGLLYHTTTMLQTAQNVCDVYKALYPSLSRELVYAGIILHDIAKCEELSVGNMGLATAYSTAGQLVGHINMGVAMVERAAAELMISEETKQLVEHILLSHHGVPEYGSPKPPMFPEAEIVSTIDVLDSKLYEMFDALESIDEGEFSDRQWALDNRQIYKHGHV